MSFWRQLYLRLRYQWRLHYLVPLLLFLPLMTLLSTDPFDSEIESGEPVAARITSLGVGQNRYQGRTPGVVVSAETETGAIGRAIVLPADIAGCKVGSQIMAEQKGIKLYLKPKPCVD